MAGPRQAKRVIWYQLPPRGFWVWACGGLSVFDAVIIAAWTALNVIYVWQRVAFIVPLFKCALRFIWACRAMLQAADACHIPVCEHGTQQQTRVFDCAVCVLIFLFIFCSHLVVVDDRSRVVMPTLLLCFRLVVVTIWSLITCRAWHLLELMVALCWRQRRPHWVCSRTGTPGRSCWPRAPPSQASLL